MPMSGESDENKEAPDNHAESETANQSGGSDPQLPPAITPPEPPQAPASSEAPDKEPSKWREKTKLGLEIAGVVILICYTVFTYLQWRQIRRTNDLTQTALKDNGTALDKTLLKMQGQVDAAWASITQSHQQFVMEQRPYLAETNRSTERPTIFSNPNTPGQVQIVWDWHMTNYGKSPANQIIMNQEMSTDGITFIPSYGGSGKAGGKAHDAGGSAPPGSDSFNTIFSAPMQPREANKILNSPSGVAIRVRITYQDLSGTIYETAICTINKAVGAVAYCKNYNYIH
jgi:hypothetical protein